MNTRAIRMSPWASAAAVLLAVPVALAADWHFDPVLTVGWQHNDNVSYSQNNPQGDSVYTAAARLTLAAATPRTRFSLAVEPTGERYGSADNRDLDHVSYFSGATLDHDLGPRTRLNLGLTWTNWRRPRLAFEAPNGEQVVTGLQYTTVTGNVGLDFSVSPRTHVVFSATANKLRYSFTTPVSADAAAVFFFQDSKSFDGSLGLQHMYTPTDSGRLDYRVSRIEEATPAVATATGVQAVGAGTSIRAVHRGLLTYSHGEITRGQWSVTGGVAVTRVIEKNPLILDQETPTTFVANANYAGRLPSRTDVIVGAGRDISGAGGLGASTTQSVYGSIRQPVGAFSSVSALATYSHINPLDVTLASIDNRPVAPRSATSTTGLRGEYAAALAAQWSIVFGAEWVRQDSTGYRLDSVTNSWEGTDSRVQYRLLNIGVRWAPTARPGANAPQGAGGPR